VPYSLSLESSGWMALMKWKLWLNLISRTVDGKNNKTSDKKSPEHFHQHDYLFIYSICLLLLRIEKL
jgi:hypothetical protein